MSYIISSTVDVDKFAGLNFCSFTPPPTEVLQKYHCVSLARSVYYLRVVLLSMESFHSALENRESLAQ